MELAFIRVVGLNSQQNEVTLTMFNSGKIDYRSLTPICN